MTPAPLPNVGPGSAGRAPHCGASQCNSLRLPGVSSKKGMTGLPAGWKVKSWVLTLEPLGAMSSPNRYRHVALRYYFLPDWKDKYDVPGWDVKRRPLKRRQEHGEEPAAPLNRVENEGDLSIRQDSRHQGVYPGLNTPPRIQIPVDRSPRFKDANGNDSGAVAPPPKGRRKLSRVWKLLLAIFQN